MKAGQNLDLVSLQPQGWLSSSRRALCPWMGCHPHLGALSFPDASSRQPRLCRTPAPKAGGGGQGVPLLPALGGAARSAHSPRGLGQWSQASGLSTQARAPLQSTRPRRAPPLCAAPGPIAPLLLIKSPGSSLPGPAEVSWLQQPQLFQQPVVTDLRDPGRDALPGLQQSEYWSSCSKGRGCPGKMRKQEWVGRSGPVCSPRARTPGSELYNHIITHSLRCRR